MNAEEALDTYDSSSNLHNIHAKANSNNIAEITSLTADIDEMKAAVKLAGKAAVDGAALIKNVDKAQQQLKDKFIKRFKSSWAQERANFLNIAERLDDVPVAPAPVAVPGPQQYLQKAKATLKVEAEQLAKEIKKLDNAIANIGATKKHFRVK